MKQTLDNLTLEKFSKKLDNPQSAISNRERNGMLNFFTRALNCGAIDDIEILQKTGLSLAELNSARDIYSELTPAAFNTKSGVFGSSGKTFSLPFVKAQRCSQEIPAFFVKVSGSL